MNDLRVGDPITVVYGLQLVNAVVVALCDDTPDEFPDAFVGLGAGPYLKWAVRAPRPRIGDITSYRHFEDENYNWCRGWEGEAVDALLASTSLVLTG